jgi:glycerol-3-phosphate dehydrogenase (NAD+)
MCEGLGLGTNTLAALVTRGCSEMTRLAVKMGARPDTLAGSLTRLCRRRRMLTLTLMALAHYTRCSYHYTGLSGIGDLMLTCFGSLSRNRTVGKRLGSGESLESILATMEEVAEGVATTPAACKLAEQYQLDLPIIKAVAAILRGDLQAREAVLHLMTLPLSDEKTW